MKLDTWGFLKGFIAGIVLAVALIWIYPEILPVTRSGGSTTSKSSSTATLERIREAGVVRIGYANEAPYAYMDSDTHRLTGESPEIARIILRRLGVKEVKGVLTEFGSLIPGLKAGRFDIIAAGMYITPERCAEAAFSNPTYGIGESFAVLKGNPLKLHSYEDVKNNPKARLGVVTGAIERDYAIKSNIPNKQIKVLPDAPSALEAVAAGRIDAYGGTSLTVRDLVKKANNPNLEIAKPFTDPVIDGKEIRGYGAFAFRKDDEELVEAFNQELEQFIGSEEHEELVKPFGFAAPELPGDVTATSLCAG